MKSVNESLLYSMKRIKGLEKKQETEAGVPWPWGSPVKYLNGMGIEAGSSSDLKDHDFVWFVG